MNESRYVWMVCVGDSLRDYQFDPLPAFFGNQDATIKHLRTLWYIWTNEDPMNTPLDFSGSMIEVKVPDQRHTRFIALRYKLREE